MLGKTLPIFCALLLATPCRADLPLTVEDLLTEQRRFRLDFGLNYINTDKNSTHARFEWVQVGAESFILLPTTVSDRRRNGDVLAVTLGARYGVTADTELYSRVTGVAESVRMAGDSGAISRSDQRFGQWVLGVNHRFSDDDDTPALLAFAEFSVAENVAAAGADIVHGRTGQLGLTAYRSIDPVVLSLTAGYRYAGSRDVDGRRVDPGDLLFINPGLGFAINNEVTATGGVRFKFQGEERVAGRSVGMRTSQTGLEFGLGYAASEHLTLNFKILANVSGQDGAQSSLDFVYKL